MQPGPRRSLKWQGLEAQKSAPCDLVTRFLVLADEAKTWGEHECLDGASMLIAKAQRDGSLSLLCRFITRFHLSAFCFPFRIHCVGEQIQIEDFFFFSSCAIHHHRTHAPQLMNLSFGVSNAAPQKQGKFKVFYSVLFCFFLCLCLVRQTAAVSTRRT